MYIYSDLNVFRSIENQSNAEKISDMTANSRSTVDLLKRICVSFFKSFYMDQTPLNKLILIQTRKLLTFERTPNPIKAFNSLKTRTTTKRK